MSDQYPIKLYGWEISPETEPNALKAGIKFRAVCDGDVKSGESVNELIQEIAEETEDYFWKANYNYKSEIRHLRKLLNKCKGSLNMVVVNLGFESAEEHKLVDGLLDEISKELNK